jgi:hypothetical protein
MSSAEHLLQRKLRTIVQVMTETGCVMGERSDAFLQLYFPGNSLG